MALPDPEEVGLPAFAYVRRGYDPEQVGAHVAGLVEQVESLRAYAADLEDREADLRAARDEAIRRGEDMARRLDGDLTELAARETEQVLAYARALADETRARAESDAAALVATTKSKAKAIWIETRRRCQARVAEVDGVVAARRAEEDALGDEVERRREDARSRAEATVQAAKGRAASLVAEAELTMDRARQAAADVVEQAQVDAQAEAQELVEEANELRERLLGDLAQQRAGLHQQIERLQAGRDRLVVAYEVVRRSWERAAAELGVAVPEAQRDAAAVVGRLLADGSLDPADDQLVEREVARFRAASGDEPAGGRTANGVPAGGDRPAPGPRAIDGGDPRSPAVRVLPAPVRPEGGRDEPVGLPAAGAVARLGATGAVDGAFTESVVVIPAPVVRPAGGGEDPAPGPAPPPEVAARSGPGSGAGPAGAGDGGDGSADASAPPGEPAAGGDGREEGEAADRVGAGPTGPPVPDEAGVDGLVAGGPGWRAPHRSPALAGAGEPAAHSGVDGADEAGQRHPWWMASLQPSGGNGTLSTVDLVAALVHGVVPPGEAAASAPLDPEQAARARCDAAVADARRSLRRRLKATLADDQNQALDALRRVTVGVPTARAVLADEPSHRRRFLEAARAGLLLAAATGRELAADLALDEARRQNPGSLPEGFTVDIAGRPAIADDLAQWLAAELLDMLRARLLACFPEGTMVSEDPRLDRARRDEVQWALRSAYRRVKGAKVDALIGRAAVEAVYRSVVDHLPAGLRPAGLEPLALFRGL